MPSSSSLMLLDTASLYFRAFYGVPDRRAEQGFPPNNAVRGLLEMIATLVTAHQPHRLVACWDDDWRPAFRVAAIPTYKTHRLAAQAPPVEPVGEPTAEEVPDLLAVQVPVIVEVLAAIGIERVGAPGYEADDVIGTLTTRYRGRGPVDIVTGDRDLFQLVSDAEEVRVLYTARGGVRDADRVDEAFLAAKYDVPSGRAYAEMAVLRGDASDGLPGVKGIGEKTAAALLKRYGDLAGLRVAIETGDPGLKGAQRRNLEVGLSYLDAAPAVVDVVCDIDMPPVSGLLPTQVADASALSELAVTHDLAGPIARLADALDLIG